MNLKDPLENCVTQANIIFRKLVDNHTSILYNNNVVNGGNDMMTMTTREIVDNILDTLGGPFLEFEISESNFSLDDIIKAVEIRYPDYKFWGTESRYESCIMAIFEKR